MFVLWLLIKRMLITLQNVKDSGLINLIHFYTHIGSLKQSLLHAFNYLHNFKRLYSLHISYYNSDQNYYYSGQASPRNVVLKKSLIQFILNYITNMKQMHGWMLQVILDILSCRGWETARIGTVAIYIYIYIYIYINNNIWRLHSLSIDENQCYV